MCHITECREIRKLAKQYCKQLK
jgi:hypothetical protein